MPAQPYPPVRVCVDRIVPDRFRPAAAAAERAIRSVHATATRQARTGVRSAALADLNANDVVRVARIAIVNLKKWDNGKKLRCRFLDGGAFQQDKVVEKAKIWEAFANITFDFGDDPDAEVRISFQADDGSWSAVGTDALVEAYFPKYQPTMNYGWLRDDTDDDEYERVVVHEFGHALGAIHEHQQPAAALDWNAEAVYRYFAGPPNYWKKEDIDFNVLQKYGQDGISNTEFDPNSIMLYAFPGELFNSGQGTQSNDHLSERDKAFIAQMYPKPDAAAGGGGNG